MPDVSAESRSNPSQWMQSEESLCSVFLRQLWRLMGRARKRRWATGAVAVAVFAVLFAVQIRRPSLHTAEVGLLISEGLYSPDGRPRPRGEMFAFINRAVFAIPRLQTIVRKHDLAKALGVPSEALAVDRMRRFVRVQIWHDYFSLYRQHRDPPRTVRVTVEFAATDANLALAVARDLGELVAETQVEREIQAADARVNARRVLAGSAASRAIGLGLELERAKQLSLEYPGGAAYVSIERLSDAVKAADKASMAAAADLVDAELHARSIRRVGNLVQVVDPGAPLWRPMTRGGRLLRQGILSLLVGIFVAVVLVGAWDPSVRDEQDLRRVGLPQLGKVPPCQAIIGPSEV